MLHAEQQRRAGIALVIAAAVAWSTAPFFTRLLHFDSWTILFWRGLFGGASISLFLILAQGWRGLRDLVTMRGNGWLVACLSTLGMVAFIPALQLEARWFSRRNDDVSSSAALDAVVIVSIAAQLH